MDIFAKKILYLGPEGTYSQIATHDIIEKYNLSSLIVEPHFSIKSIIDIVDKGEDMIAVVPIENSIEGVVRETIDNLTKADDKALKIVAEYVLPINNCLLAKEQILKDEIKTLLSYTQPLAQCRCYINDNLNKNIQIKETNSTAAAAKELLSADKTTAAIANEHAAKVYGLKILEKNINDNKENKTRFVVLAKQTTHSTGNDRTSVVFSTANVPGALCDILTIFKKYDINLSYIDSRPSVKNLKEYNFYIDFDGHIDDSLVKTALAEMFEYTTFFRHNGSYPKY